MFKYLTLLVALVSPAMAFAGWFGPSNYDECVLESMKGVTSDVAARAIMRSCKEKFPEKRPNDTELPASVVSQLDGRAGKGYSSFSGSIYNGNKEWTITQLTIVIAPKTEDKSADPTRRAKEYNVDVTVPPLTNKDFYVSADRGGATEFDWSITKARGFRSR